MHRRHPSHEDDDGEVVSRSRVESSPSPSPFANAHGKSGRTLTSSASAPSHHQIHSRNLSLYFPRPGQPASATIAEDGTQELEIPAPSSAPSFRIDNKPTTPLGAGFTFGSRPPGSAVAPSPPLLSSKSTSSATSRRGHHHKHSLSHNFFSFLEPGSDSPQLHTQPAPTPLSPWTPMSAMSASPNSATSTFAAKQAAPPIVPSSQPRNQPSGTSVLAALSQFILGSFTWIQGQQVGSLACTALGYWTVFDSIGLVLCTGLALKWMGLHELPSQRDKIRRPFGTARVSLVLLFAQAVYLMFAAVYVCKETVEHILLSAGGGVAHGDGHHHRPGDEDIESGQGIDFPLITVALTIISTLGTSMAFDNHSELVSLANIRINLHKLIKTLAPLSKSIYSYPPPEADTDPWSRSLSNPFTSTPILLALALLTCSAVLPPSSQHSADLVIAATIAAVTGDLAYHVCVVLGTTLLQTAPSRLSKSAIGDRLRTPSSSGNVGEGKMERFLRAMREVERHPQVLHLPAPHVWEVSPQTKSPALDNSYPSLASKSAELVVTLDLHVATSLPDSDAMKLSRWAWERCVSALGVPGALALLKDRGEPDGLGVDVTVGIVRG